MNRYLIAVVSILFASVLLARPEPCSAAAGNGDISGDGTVTMTDVNLTRLQAEFVFNYMLFFVRNFPNAQNIGENRDAQQILFSSSGFFADENSFQL